MRLSDLKTGESAVIVKILGHGAFRKRMIEMGFVRGRHIKALLSAPLRDPVKYSLMDYEVSLRCSEASLVEVILLNEDGGGNEPKLHQDISMNGVVSSDNAVIDNRVHGESHTINVALIGNPNCGKTSMFNIASGAKEHVGNYSGVTVDAKKGTFHHGGYTFNIVDLPGTYSLSSYSPEELYVRRYLQEETPDVIINVVVASNLERNLYLTTELIDMDRSMVIALNMFDELQASGAKLDYDMLGGMIGVPVVPTVSRTGKGVEQLFDTVINVYEGRHESVRHIHVSLGEEVESAVTVLKDIIKGDGTVAKHFSPRYLAIKFLENDAEADAILSKADTYDKLLEIRNRQRQRIEKTHDEDIASVIGNAKYGFIAGALAETLEKESEDQIRNHTHLIDLLVTNRLLGIPIFLAVMFVIFWFTFEIGSYPMEWIETAVSWLGSVINANFADGPLKDLLANGVVGGVGGVIVFLPNILILYFFISFMEDSGYMARAAFIMDRVMHRIGLHGKSFIPLVMGFGCNVPAVMASRSIESRSSRLITILINPFMSCSARLPVYVLLVGTFFDRHASLVFMSMYLLGVAVAVITARMLRRFWFKSDETPFVMELPPYRMPSFKSSVRHMWGKAEQYLKKMGGIILIGSIVVWALDYFPLHDTAGQVSDDAGIVSEVPDDGTIDLSTDSYLEMIGKLVNPVMEPLGFHWRATVSVIAGIPAKEIVVSTLGVLYTESDSASEQALSERLTAPSVVTGKPDFTSESALAFMAFILLYCPCIATIVAIVKESGSWKYGAFTVVYNTVVAWIVALMVYRTALLF